MIFHPLTGNYLKLQFLKLLFCVPLIWLKLNCNKYTIIILVVKCSVADPVHFFSDPDPDPTYYLDMF